MLSGVTTNIRHISRENVSRKMMLVQFSQSIFMLKHKARHIPATKYVYDKTMKEGMCCYT